MLGRGEYFFKAIPVWQSGKEKELHSRCAFFVRFSCRGSAVLRVAACNAYKLYLNGKCIAAGPARAAHGYFRVDEIPLESLREENVLFAEVAAYNTYNYCHLNQPAFFCAEIISDGKPVVWTGEHFVVREYAERKRKVLKFSYQRAFTEVYEFRRDPQKTYLDFSADGNAAEFERPAAVSAGIWLPRGVSYPSYPVYRPILAETGAFCETEREPALNTWLRKENLGIFRDEELVSDSDKYLQRLEYESRSVGKTLQAGEYLLFDYLRSQTGFLGIRFYAEQDSVVFLVFDEIDLNGGKGKTKNIRFDRGGCVNVIEYRVKAGETYVHTSFEPYTAKFVKILVKSGAICGVETSIVGYENPDSEGFSFTCSDKRLERIIEAARGTFCQNALDILTDCPSRERAGWLCDSFFSGRTEQLLTGKNKVEFNFLENYAYASVKGLPKGMLPMCYPADFTDHKYIPNWAMFYVIETYDAYLRTGDFSVAEKNRKNILGAIGFFDRYRNEEGLLENLESWIFVEWSMANDDDYICGVNYPSNMLYAKALECAGQMYSIGEYLERAEKIRAVIEKESFNGEFFEDNRTRKDGKLIATGHTTETCQYYAFFCGVATPQTYPELFRKLVDHFGANRDAEKVFPKVYKSNAFIGNYLRLMILTEFGEKKRLARECVQYFYDMAVQTGTLWEYDDDRASLNHGFAAYAANLIVDYVTGYKGAHGRELIFSDAASDEDCRVQIPLEQGVLKYERENGNVKISVPKGYRVIRNEGF